MTAAVIDDIQNSVWLVSNTSVNTFQVCNLMNNHMQFTALVSTCTLTNEHSKKGSERVKTAAFNWMITIIDTSWLDYYMAVLWALIALKFTWILNNCIHAFAAREMIKLSAIKWCKMRDRHSSVSLVLSLELIYRAMGQFWIMISISLSLSHSYSTLTMI